MTPAGSSTTRPRKCVSGQTAGCYANAVLPPWGGKENLYELERCLKGLGMVGVQLACHYGQLYLDDEAFKPYLRVLDEMNVPVRRPSHAAAGLLAVHLSSRRTCAASSAASSTRPLQWGASCSAACSRNSRTSSSSTLCSAATGLPTRTC